MISLSALYIALPLLLAFLVPLLMPLLLRTPAHINGQMVAGAGIGGRALLPVLLFGFILAQVFVLHTVLYTGSYTEVIVLAAPLGVSLQASVWNVFMLLVFSIVALWSVVTLLQTQRAQPIFVSVFLLHLAGLNGMLLTTDIFNVFVFFEMASVSGYILSAYSKTGRAERASLYYLLMGSVASVAFLLAIAFIYRHTGSLHYQTIAMNMQNVPLVVRWLIFGLLAVAWGIESEWFPLNAWVPGVYKESLPGVTVLFGATTVKASLLVFVVLSFLIFPTGEFAPWFIGFGVVTLLVGQLAALAALQTTSLMGTLALGSVAQVGFLSMGFMFAQAQPAVLFHAVSHSLAVMILVGIAGAWASRGLVAKHQLVGIGYQQPLVAVVFTVASLSVIGFPPFMGFVGKFAILQSLAFSPWLVMAVLLAALVEAWYLGKIVISLWQKPQGEATTNPLTAASSLPATHSLSGTTSLLGSKISQGWLFVLPAILLVILGLWPQIIFMWIGGVHFG
jgi:multicomponent Na+:H+ antiporter subunit D